jgi:uncharacterized membrane protein YphA (DoxX/SURF4 family)
MTNPVDQASLVGRASEVYERLLSIFAHFDGFASLLLRLILGPVLIAAGWEKLSGENWFGYQLESFPFPFNVLPAEFSWFLASWTEFLGGILLLAGLGTRLVAIPLAVTMFVAAWAVHLDNGWPAILEPAGSLHYPERRARRFQSLRALHQVLQRERTDHRGIKTPGTGKNPPSGAW